MSTTTKRGTSTTTTPRDEAAPPRWVIFDVGDPADGGQTYFYSFAACQFCGAYHDQLWGPERRHAWRFDTFEEAHDAVEDCDPEHWLRDRLIIFPSVAS